MDYNPTSSDKKTLKRWFFIDKRVGWKNLKVSTVGEYCLESAPDPKAWFFSFFHPKAFSLLLIHLETMDLKSSHTSPVLADPALINESMLGIHSGLLPYSHNGTAFSPAPFLTIPRRKPGILDDVRSSSWLDAMKSSSPTHNKVNKDSSTGQSSNDSDNAYRTWMVISNPLFDAVMQPYFPSTANFCPT